MLKGEQIQREVMCEFWKEYEELTREEFKALENWRLESIRKSKDIALD